jgi:hypothetical protein
MVAAVLLNLTRDAGLADGWRWFVMFEGGLVIALCVIIFTIYARSFARGVARPLHLHILAISVSHIGLTFFAGKEVYAHLGEPLTWRIPSALFLFGLSDYALAQMLRHTVTKQHAAKRK